MAGSALHQQWGREEACAAQWGSGGRSRARMAGPGLPTVTCPHRLRDMYGHAGRRQTMPLGEAVLSDRAGNLGVCMLILSVLVVASCCAVCVMERMSQPHAGMHSQHPSTPRVNSMQHSRCHRAPVMQPEGVEAWVNRRLLVRQLNDSQSRSLAKARLSLCTRTISRTITKGLLGAAAVTR